jgi:hypothetical protein
MTYYPIKKSIWFKSKIVVPVNEVLYNDIITSFNLVLSTEKEFDVLIKKEAPSQILVYNTFYRDINEILKIVNFLKASELLNNYKINHLTLSIRTLKTIYNIFQISSRAFQSYETYEKINFLQFLYYNILQKTTLSSQVMVIKDNEKAIGFIVFYIFENNMYLKTIAILPEYRNKSLTKNLILATHNLALSLKLKGAYYINIMEGNAVDKFPKAGAILVSISYLLKNNKIK